jgi:hypothetical protein
MKLRNHTFIIALICIIQHCDAKNNSTELDVVLHDVRLQLGLLAEWNEHFSKWMILEEKRFRLMDFNVFKSELAYFKAKARYESAARCVNDKFQSSV